MAQCVYCLKGEDTTTFISREHVIPQGLGSFEPLNPTIKGGLVCDICNTKIFNPIETIFMEDALEGVHGQRLNMEGQNSVIMRDKNFQISQITGFGDDFFNQMFFFLKPQDGRLVVDFKNQIKLRRFQGGCRVFLPEALESIRADSAKFKKISADFQKLDQKDMCMFAENRERIDQMIAILKSFGITYKEKETKGHYFKPGDLLELKEEYTCRIDQNTGRVLAKIAFNYFIYCTQQAGMSNVLYASNFDKIRRFIYKADGILKEIIPSINEDPILWEEVVRKKRFIAHMINFLEENGEIIIRMSFFGLPAIYRVVLGTLPQQFTREDFGCGHAFNPFTREIHNLSQQPSISPTSEQIRLSFGLFKRIRS